MSAPVTALRRAPFRVRSHLVKMMPAPRAGRMWLYAISFRGGSTKIGITTAPRNRLLALWRESGLFLDWMHLFGSVDGSRARQWERATLSLAAVEARRNGQAETFGGLSREQAIRCARLAREMLDRRAAA